jgi:hypothetical protein
MPLLNSDPASIDIHFPAWEDEDSVAGKLDRIESYCFVWFLRLILIKDEVDRNDPAFQHIGLIYARVFQVQGTVLTRSTVEAPLTSLYFSWMLLPSSKFPHGNGSTYC